MHVYLDESGDMGWNFSLPYRAGGSSRYLTIAFLIVPIADLRRPKNIIKSLYQKTGTPVNTELKSKDLSPAHKQDFARLAVNLANNNVGVKYSAITVNKQNVQNHIRRDANKLYNYMTKFALLDFIDHHPEVYFVPDIRTIKVASGNSLFDYLQTTLWFERGSQTILHNQPGQSDKMLNLQFADNLAHIIWKKHEDNDRAAFDILRPKLAHKELFF